MSVTPELVERWYMPRWLREMRDCDVGEQSSPARKRFMSMMKDVVSQTEKEPRPVDRSYLVNLLYELFDTALGRRIIAMNARLAHTIIDKRVEFINEPALYNAPFFNSFAFERVTQFAHKHAPN